jgi:hypothetical protein
MVERVLVERQNVLSQMRVIAGVIVGLKCEIMGCNLLLDFLFFIYFSLVNGFFISRRNFFLKF